MTDIGEPLRRIRVIPTTPPVLPPAMATDAAPLDGPATPPADLKAVPAPPPPAFTVGVIGVVLRAGFFGLVAFFAAIGVAYGWLFRTYTAGGADLPGLWVYAVVVPVVFLTGSLIHEGGHVLASAMLTARRWSTLTFQGRGMMVTFSARLPAGWRGGVIAAAGPLLELAVSLGVLAVLGGTGAVVTPVGFALLFSVFAALMNLLVPMSRTSDAVHIYRALMRRRPGI